MRANVAILLIALAAPALAAPTDEDAIRALQARQAETWNRHDAKAYAALFTEAGDVVNVLGWRWRGRAEIESKLTDAFAWVFRDSTLAITDVDVRMLGPKAAVAYVRWTMDGAKAPPGAPRPPATGIQLQVLEKKAGAWLISSFQNTTSVPEAPFPKGPPPSGS